MSIEEVAPALSPYADEILKKTRSRVESYFESRDDWNLSRSLKNLTDQAVLEYAHRTLLELVQNAHDAQPPEVTDGRILIRLDHEDGPHGSLLVANTGAPFTQSNFDAICDVAQSDKRADEGIGNKGIGFKSTLQLSRLPEVYSLSGEGAPMAYDGYCFSFVDSRDLLDLAGGDSVRANELASDVFHLCLPVPLSSVPDSVAPLAAEGYVTAIRLQLNSEAAREEAGRQIEEFLGDPPSLVFLRRIEQVVVEEILATEVSRRSLRREETPAALVNSQTTVSEVGLSGVGRFFLAERLVDKDGFAEAIGASISEGMLSEGWRNWNGEVRVALAVPLDAEMEEGRLYTFLPMGEHATAPLACHVNAPFFSRLARLDFEVSVPLNDFLLDEIAHLAASVIISAASGAIKLDSSCVVDLLAWRKPGFERLVIAFENQGHDLQSAEVLPLRRRGVWGNLRSTRSWQDDGLQVLTASAVSRQLSLLAAGIRGDRLDRLHAFARLVVGTDLEPTDTEIAVCGEALAKKQASKQFKRRWWERFYDELAGLIEDRSVLQGRKLLIDDDGKVRRCWNPDAERPGPTPFFSPRVDDTHDADASDLRFPKRLSRRIFFVNQQLRWTTPKGSGRERTRGRRLLSDGGLVKEYRADEMFSVLARLMEKSPSPSLCLEALSWVVSFVQARDDPPWKEISSVGFLVPTGDGEWIRAADAHFSKQWDDPVDTMLERFIEQAANVSEDVALLKTRLLASPEEWPFTIRDVPEMRQTLEHLGVRPGLAPIPIARSQLSGEGRTFEDLSIVTAAPMDPSTRKLWRTALESRRPTRLRPHTNYRSGMPLSRLPGQDDFEEFDEQAKRFYAQLITIGLETWPESALEVEVRRYNDGADRFQLPTPLAAFLRHSSWVPISQPGERHIWEFVQPSEAWSVRITEDAAPNFAPLVPIALRRLADSRLEALKRLEGLGVRFWDSPNTAADRVILLPRLLESGTVPESALASIRKAYEEAWEHLVADTPLDPFDADDGLVLVSRRDRLGTTSTGNDSDELIYVQDGGSQQALRLVEQSGAAVVPLRPSVGRSVADVLQPHLGSRLRRLSQADMAVKVDGEPFEPSRAGPLLVDENLGWFADLIAVLVDVKSGQFRRLGPESIRRAVETVRRVRVVLAEHFVTLVDGQELGVSTHALAVADDHCPTVILKRTEVSEPLSVLGASAQAVAELIGYPDIADSIRLSLIDLNRLGALDQGSPSLADLAELVGVTEQRVREIVLGGSHTAISFARLAAPLVATFSPSLAMEFWQGVEAMKDEPAARAWLVKRFRDHGLDVDPLLEACRRDDLNAARDYLGISLPDLNDAIRALGVPFEPLHNREGIHSAFNYYINLHRDAILDSLRHEFLASFRRQEPLVAYVECRDLQGLEPDPSWIDTYFDLDDEIIRSHVDNWLESFGAPRMEEVPRTLPSLDSVRQSNRALVAEVVTRANAVVLAWERTHSLPISGLPGSTESVLDAAATAGWLDFEPLDELAAIAWLAINDHWPQGMPNNLDVEKMSINEADLRAAKTLVEQTGQGRIREARQVVLDGIAFDGDPLNYPAIYEAVKAGIKPSFLENNARPASMIRLDRPGSRKSGVAGGRVRAGRSPRLSEIQAGAVGLVGETVAFEWLRAHYGSSGTVSWCSGYRDDVLGGSEGDDSLGYDFEVLHREVRLLFEVKSTVGENGEFALTDGEIRAAQVFGTAYNILFITRVLDSDERSLHLLGNPFTPSNAGFYRTIGSGIRLQFRLDDS